MKRQWHAYYCSSFFNIAKGHTSDLDLVHEVSGLKREVKRVADALEELIAIKRAKTDSEVKSEVPSEDSDIE